MKKGVLDRAQHPKSHGLVQANFTVAEDIPERFRLGAFARVRSFPAKIRFPNGAAYDDERPDVHGMVIKLMDVKAKVARRSVS